MVAAPPLLTAGGNSHQVCTLMLPAPKDMAIGSLVGRKGERMGLGCGRQSDLQRMGKPEKAWRDWRKTRTGTGNDFA